MVKSVAAALLLLFLLIEPLFAQEEEELLFSAEGSLAAGDQTAGDGSFVDFYQFDVSEGERVAVVVDSQDFDSYLTVSLPDGEEERNDDYVDWNAGVEFLADRSGRVEIAVSSLFSGETGAYTVRAVRLPEPRELGINERVEGSLGRSSLTGRLADQYLVTGSEGERLRINLVSEEFDAFLQLLDSSGRRFSDDDGGSATNSRLSYQFPEDGFLIVTATSFDGRSAGEYELIVEAIDATDARVVEGSLAPGDNRSIDGRLYDVVRIEAEAGERITANLESEDFDAFLYLNFSSGENYDSDDDSGGGSNAMIDLVAPRDDTYTLVVTSYFAGRGEYRLTIFQ
ncbi:MAG: pre-peptidase C-terminal domain-containing protein [Alkalispirochaetaceae bacterium]